MAEPVNALAAYLSPEQRRRIGNALMAGQYDRATPEEGNVSQRHGLLPLATYDNGRTGLAFPGLVAEPVESFNRLLQNGYTSGDAKGVEDAFNVAGAAMMGGIAAPRPRGSLGTVSREQPASTVRAYRGSNGEFSLAEFDPSASNPSWRTNEGALFFGSQDAANVYGAPQTAFDQQLYSSIVKKHTRPDGRMNPQAIAKEYEAVAPQEGMASVMPADINTQNFGTAYMRGYEWQADEGARLKREIDKAKSQGKDGIEILGMMDASGYTDPQYAVWGRGTIYSPLTGELLYANGGQLSPAVNALLQSYGYGQPDQPRPASPKYLPGDA